ncbi:MAG TPA: class I SAM-dependent methyltransferase [Acetobacteraceae bacterium]|jgi:SAM-dependent methyltransferase|nr:class I SAM-dependent methyltransferase [Acetobacteraceae bacterium]
MSDATDARLAAQYEAYPYPKRDPRDEAKRLIVGSPGHLREIDHWIFGATRPASRPLHALFAGGGTGDGTLMLAQQIARAGRAGSVTWLDRSAASLKIAQARAGVRGLSNIVWESRSLLDLPGSGLGPFDYIDCCGVLHHLPEPIEGLRALTSVLAPGGGLGLMVYAPHGRTGVYMVQDALRLLAPAAETPTARLDTARRVMRHLPETAWLRQNHFLDDHVNGGDAGLYDLLLNPRDRAFTVKQFVALLAEAGLRVVCFVEPLRYDPATWLPDPKLRTRVEAMDPIDRAALAEALTGNINAHIVYCVRADAVVERADPTTPDAVPIGREVTGEYLASVIQPDGTLTMAFDGLRAPIPLPAMAPAILRLIDGARSVGEISRILAERGSNPDAFTRAWKATFSALERVNRLLLAAPA